MAHMSCSASESENVSSNLERDSLLAARKSTDVGQLMLSEAETSALHVISNSMTMRQSIGQDIRG